MHATRLATVVWALVAVPVLADEKPARVDLYGDPLPEGAVARLGTTRFHAHSNCVAFSADGKLVATGTSDWNARLWETATGCEVGRFQGNKIGVQIWQVAISPDGNTFATLDSDNGVMLWEARTGKFLRVAGEKNQPLPTGRMTCTPDSRLLFVGAGKGFRAFNVADGKDVDPPAPPERDLTIDGVSPDGTAAVSVTEGGRLVVWELATGKKIGEVQGPGGRGVLALAPGGKQLARAVRGDHAIDVYDIVAGKELAPCKGHAADVLALAFSPDGKVLLSAAIDLTSRGWDADTGKERWTYRGVKGYYYSAQLACSPDGKAAAFVAWDGALRLLDPLTGEEKSPTVQSRSGLYPLTVSADGKTVIASARDQSIRAWDLTTGKELHTIREPQRDTYDTQKRQIVRTENDVSQLQLTADGKTLLVDESPGARLWDVSDPARPRPEKLLVEHSNACLAHDGKTAVVLDGTIRFVDLASGKVVRESKKDGFWGRPCLSADGRVLAIGDQNATVHVFEARTFRPVATLRNGGVQYTTSLAFSPDGQLLASSSSGDWQVNLWEVASGKLWRSVALPRGASSAIAFSPNGRYLATAGGKQGILMHDLASGDTVHTFRGHDAGVNCLAFTPDGRRLVSAAGDSTALVWDMGAVPAPKRKAAERTAKELDALWERLGGDADEAEEAIRSLTASPDQAAVLLARRLKPADAEKEKRLALLVRDLDSDVLAERDRATAALQEVGVDAVEPLLAALGDEPTPEMERRAGRLLDRLNGKPPSPERLRALRAVRVLGFVGTPPARKALEAVAAGPPDAELTRAAVAALSCTHRR